MESDDLLIVFSVSGGEHIMEEALRANGKVMLVTSKPDPRYTDKVDKLVVLPHLSSRWFCEIIYESDTLSIL